MRPILSQVFPGEPWRPVEIWCAPVIETKRSAKDAIIHPFPLRA